MIIAFLKHLKVKQNQMKKLHLVQKKNNQIGSSSSSSSSNHPFLPYLPPQLQPTTTSSSNHSSPIGGIPSSPLTPTLLPSYYQLNDIGHVLMMFLDFYRQFNFQSMGIIPVNNHAADTTTSSRNNEYFYTINNISQTLVLCDPFDITNNCGKSIFGMHNIKHLFNDMFECLIYRCHTSNNKTLLNTILQH